MKRFKWTIWLTLLTLPLLIIAVYFADGGHGSYIPAMSLFPFGLLSTILFGRITTPFIVISIIQFPLYGLLIDKSVSVNKFKLILTIIALVHILLAAFIIMSTGESWK
jgi:hypothetical protein